jgi:hypothetical protein
VSACPDTTNVKLAGVHDGMELLARNGTKTKPRISAVNCRPLIDDIKFRSFSAVRASGEYQAILQNSENMPDGRRACLCRKSVISSSSLDGSNSAVASTVFISSTRNASSAVSADLLTAVASADVTSPLDDAQRTMLLRGLVQHLVLDF